MKIKYFLQVILFQVLISATAQAQPKVADINEQLVDTWNIHNNINLYLLQEVPADHLKDLSASKGRTVAEQFAHIHTNRLQWLNEISPDLTKDLIDLVDGNALLTKELLITQLTKSSKAIEALLRRSLKEGSLKNHPHPTTFFGYLISHESHHRGQIVLSLKQSGHPLSEKVSYGLWNWTNN